MKTRKFLSQSKEQVGLKNISFEKPGITRCRDQTKVKTKIKLTITHTETTDGVPKSLF